MPPTPPNPPLHVVLLNQAFHPDVVATAQMAKDLADELVKGGMEVTAIASRSIYGKSGATLPRHEIVKVNGGEIEIHRVGFSFFGRASTALRILDFGFFYLLAAVKLMTMRRPDVVVGFSTPPYIALLAILCRWLRGSRAVYWAMDLYPDVIVASGMITPGSPVTRVLDFLHRWLVRSADASVVLGRCMMEKVLAKAGDKARARVKFIPVWSDETGVRPVAREANPLRTTFGLGDAFTVMYSGNFGHGHDAATTMHAMSALKGRTSTGPDGVRFLFVGGGKRRKEVEAFIAKESISNAAYHDYQPREKLAESLSCGDVHLISLLEGMEGLIVPSKCFGIMAVARPAIFIGNPSSEIARVLTENDCGIVVRQGDGEGLTRAIESLAGDPARARAMGERGHAAFMEHYSRTKACGAWCELLAAVCGGEAESFGGYGSARAGRVSPAGTGAVR
ncbi:MAG: glycosyltransferase family 4 protein [Phycisphaerales bacterium]